MQILETSEQHGIRTILVMSPDYLGAHEFIRNRTDTLRTYREIADRFRVPFWDYSRAPMSAERAYFYNSQHLNHEGAAVFSTILARRFVTENGRPALSRR